MSKERSIPKIEPKLVGQNNYAQWILSIEQTLSSYEHEEETIWEIVTGKVKDPDSEAKGKSADTKVKQWRRDNNFAILTMKRNCESEAVDVIELARTANEAYLELQAKYEGKTISTLGALLINVIKTSYDDRTQTIEEHISDFDKKWSFM